LFSPQLCEEAVDGLLAGRKTAKFNSEAESILCADIPPAETARVALAAHVSPDRFLMVRPYEDTPYASVLSGLKYFLRAAEEGHAVTSASVRQTLACYSSRWASSIAAQSNLDESSLEALNSKFLSYVARVKALEFFSLDNTDVSNSDFCSSVFYVLRSDDAPTYSLEFLLELFSLALSQKKKSLSSSLLTRFSQVLECVLERALPSVDPVLDAEDSLLLVLIFRRAFEVSSTFGNAASLLRQSASKLLNVLSKVDVSDGTSLPEEASTLGEAVTSDDLSTGYVSSMLTQLQAIRDGQLPEADVAEQEVSEQMQRASSDSLFFVDTKGDEKERAEIDSLMHTIDAAPVDDDDDEDDAPESAAMEIEVGVDEEEEEGEEEEDDDDDDEEEEEGAEEGEEEEEEEEEEVQKPTRRTRKSSKEPNSSKKGLPSPRRTRSGRIVKR